MQSAYDFVRPYIVGYGVALVWGHIVIREVSSTLYRKLGLPRRERYGASHASILGAVEGALYVSALQFERPEFIAVWLGLKTVVTWRHWETDVPIIVDKQPRWILGRNVYNIFLLGNALVILFAAVGWKLIELLVDKECSAAIAIGVALAVGSIVLVIAARLSQEYPALERGDHRLSPPHGPR